MRLLHWASLLCAAVWMQSALAAAAAPSGGTTSDWHNALAPVGKASRRVAIAKGGKALGGIHLPSQPTGPELKAAADLQSWIQQIAGATLPTNSPLKKSVLILRTEPSLGDEGYSIEVEKGRIVLSGGRTRGVVNAVYALLEEDLGCRFYTADSLRLPKTNTLALAVVERSYRPSLKLRDPFYAAAFNAEWSLRNRSNAPRAAVPEEHGGHVDYDGMFVHTAAQMIPADKFLTAHPDYFAQKADGSRTTAQLCATHPEVAELAIVYVRDVRRQHPHAEILSISKNDNTEVCHCARCTKLRSEEGSDMACQLVLVNKVAEAVEKDHPDLVIDTLADLETSGVPKTARPRKNVAIRLCNDSVGAWSHPFTPAAECEVAKLASAWGAAHHRIYVWDYNVNFSHYLAPMPNLDVMAANIRFWVRNNAEGVMLQGGYQGLAEQDELKSWVTAKLLWNPAWNERALETDFIRGHYGKAAPALEKYQKLLDELRVSHKAAMAKPAGGIRYGMDAAFLTPEFARRADEVFAEAIQLAGSDPALLRRVERARLPLLYVKCARGPAFAGSSYPEVVREFERIARREKVQYLAEGDQDFEPKLAGFKKLAGEAD